MWVGRWRQCSAVALVQRHDRLGYAAMNPKLWPMSANAVASLGDVWLAKKNTTKPLEAVRSRLTATPVSI